jgi:hypothetical protein
MEDAVPLLPLLEEEHEKVCEALFLELRKTTDIEILASSESNPAELAS